MGEDVSTGEVFNYSIPYLIFIKKKKMQILIINNQFNCVQTLTGHADRVVSLCVTAKNLFSGSSDGTLRVRVYFLSFLLFIIINDVCAGVDFAQFIIW